MALTLFPSPPLRRQRGVPGNHPRRHLADEGTPLGLELEADHFAMRHTGDPPILPPVHYPSQPVPEGLDV